MRHTHVIEHAFQRVHMHDPKVGNIPVILQDRSILGRCAYACMRACVRACMRAIVRACMRVASDARSLCRLILGQGICSDGRTPLGVAKELQEQAADADSLLRSKGKGTDTSTRE